MAGPEDKTVVRPVSAPAQPTQPTMAAGGSTDATKISGPLSAAKAPPPPPTIPDVELQGEIGRGGMGMVWRGRQTYLDRPVAVKLLLIDPENGGGEYVRRFQREARILAGLSHPHIVGCYQAGLTPQGLPYLVMEYIDGPNLRDWVREHGPLPSDQALDLVIALAEALAHAQASTIIHRDVKPENVLLAKARADAVAPWTPKLVDLGLARPAAKGTHGSDMHLTMQGVVMGTPATMAPEQFGDPDNVDFRADIYGLGCVLFHALTGGPAFTNGTLGEILTAKVSGTIPDPQEARVDLPPAVGGLVRWMLAREPGARPQSYQELIARCRELRAGGGGPRSRTAGLAIAGVVVALLAIAAAVFFSSRGPSGGAHAPAQPASEPSPGEPAHAPGASSLELFKTLQPAGAAEALIAASNALAGWTKLPDGQWDQSEDAAASLSGAHGFIAHGLAHGRGPTRVEGVARIGKAHEIAMGVSTRDGRMTMLTCTNLDKQILASVNQGKPSAPDQLVPSAWLLIAGPKPLEPAAEIPWSVTVDEQEVQCVIGGIRFEPISLTSDPEQVVLFADSGGEVPPEFGALAEQPLK